MARLNVGRLKMNAGGVALGILALAGSVYLGLSRGWESRATAGAAIGCLIAGALVGNFLWTTFFPPEQKA